MKLYSLTSSLHNEMADDFSAEPFVRDVEDALGFRFDCRPSFDDYDSSDSVIYVRTGGTEGIFKSIFCADGRLSIPGGAPVRLLTSGQSNSLAASMEILSFLRQNGVAGAIIHGSASTIACALQGPVAGTEKVLTFPLKSCGILEGKRYGVVGQPSDWLISSNVDYAKAREVLGCELIDIPIKELSDMAAEGSYDAPADLKAVNTPKFGKPISEDSFQMAVNIYGALKEIIAEYKLDGLTLRCFDLLTSLGNTGCLALAQLNSEGFIATCEGDVPTMLSMAVGRAVCGQSGFQVNLSRAFGDSLLFAHCTIPFSMTEDYCYDTHFESGIGVGIHGVLKEGVPMTLFKIGAGLDKYYAQDVILERNQYEDNLCRTQVIINAPGAKDYLLSSPLGNHHVLLPGAVKEAISSKL